MYYIILDSKWTVTECLKERKEVSIDPVNQSMRIGDEPYRYRIEGDQLSLEDLEQAEDDQGIIVLTKQ